MRKLLDQQLQNNDCGISAVKTVCNVLNVHFPRAFIEDKIPLNEEGATLSTLRKFFKENGFDSGYHLLDLVELKNDESILTDKLPCITPVKSTRGLHYVVIQKIKNGRLHILDPNVSKPYQLTIEEFKKKAYFSSSFLKYTDLEQVLHLKIKEELLKHDIAMPDNSSQKELIAMFNKLTYFSYLEVNYGFSDRDAATRFLKDLLFNQDLINVPWHFESLNSTKDQIELKAPILLSVKKTPDITQVDVQPTQNVYWKLYKSIKGIKDFWFIFLASSLIASGIAYISVFIFQILIDHILPSYQLNTLTLFAVGLGIFYFVDLLFYAYRKFVSIHLSNSLDRYFLSVFDEKLNRFSIQYLQSFRRGDLTERLSDSMRLKRFFTSYFSSILVNVVIALMSISILVLINWKLSLLVLFVLSFFVGLFFIFTPIIARLERQRYVAKANYFSSFIEKIDGIQVIKSMGLEHYSSNKILSGVDELIAVQTRSRYVGMANSIMSSLIVSFSILGIIWFTSREMILFNTITLGMIITFVTLSAKIFSAFGDLLDENLSLQEHKVILQRFFDFEEKKMEAEEKLLEGKSEVIPSSNGQGKIKDFEFRSLNFKNVSFEFNEENKVLTDINFQINKGEKIWIEGSNGSGKSTMCKILGMLYEPSGGSVLLNDIHTDLYDRNKLRSKIVLVSVEDLIFNETLLFNISFGRTIDMAKLIHYAKILGFYKFIAQQKEKFNYMIHENGRNLSTGQRRKVLLLRALMSEAEIVVLDEIFNGIDKDSLLSAEALLGMVKEKTFLIISHIPVKNIDFTKRYILKNGELHYKATEGEQAHSLDVRLN